MVTCITRISIENELVPLLKTLNEQVTVKDVTDGTAKGALCRITTEMVSFYIWENTTTLYLYNAVEAMKQGNKILDKLCEIKDIVNNWIKTKS